MEHWNWINAVPQTAATTFAFSSVFILLLLHHRLWRCCWLHLLYVFGYIVWSFAFIAGDLSSPTLLAPLPHLPPSPFSSLFYPPSLLPFSTLPPSSLPSSSFLPTFPINDLHSLPYPLSPLPSFPFTSSCLAFSLFPTCFLPFSLPSMCSGAR